MHVILICSIVSPRTMHFWPQLDERSLHRHNITRLVKSSCWNATTCALRLNFKLALFALLATPRIPIKGLHVQAALKADFIYISTEFFVGEHALCQTIQRVLAIILMHTSHHQLNYNL